MNSASCIDVHAHFMPGAPMPGMLSAQLPRAPQISKISSSEGHVMRGNEVFRKVRSSLWDTAARLAEMDKVGVEYQVLTPMPVTLDFAAPTDAFAAYCRWINKATAQAVTEGQGRLAGFGIVPAADQQECVAELDHLQELGLLGIEIGTRIAGMDLDDPRLGFLFEEVEKRNLRILVHPVDGGGGAIRRHGFLYDFALGMTTDTALAATSLVFGGVLRQYPNLSICMVHGCGTFTAAYPRLKLGATIEKTHVPEELDQIVSKLFVDNLVFDPGMYPALVHRFGENQIVFGSDFPFIPGQPESGLSDLKQAEQTLGPEITRKIRHENALRFLGIESVEELAVSTLQQLVPPIRKRNI